MQEPFTLWAVCLCVSHQFGGKYMFPMLIVDLYAINYGLRLCSPPVHAESLFSPLLDCVVFRYFIVGRELSSSPHFVG